MTAAVTQLAYSSTSGQLLTITNPDSTTQGFTYNSADQMLTATNELSQVTTFEYDALDRRTKVIDATAATTLLAYDAIGQLVKTTDALGGVTDFAYNNRNWQTSITYPDPDGASSLPRPVHTFAYDAAGNVLTETDSQWTSGTQVTHVYNDAGWRTSTTGPVSGATVVTGYDNLGRVKSIEDARDNVTDIEYNSRGWRTKVTQPDPDGPGSATRPVWQWSYNYAGDTLTETDARGYITTYTYNSRALVADRTQADPDGSGALFAPITDYIYDNVGRLKATDDPLGRTTAFEYNQRDWLTKVTEPDSDWTSGSQTSPVTQFGYDNAGRQTTVSHFTKSLPLEVVKRVEL